MNKKQINKDINNILINEIGRNSETGGFMVADVQAANKDEVVIRFDRGIPNLDVLGHLLSYFGVSISDIGMEGDGSDFWYSEMTADHDSWIDVIIRNPNV